MGATSPHAHVLPQAYLPVTALVKESKLACTPSLRGRSTSNTNRLTGPYIHTYMHTYEKWKGLTTENWHWDDDERHRMSGKSRTRGCSDMAARMRTKL